MSVGAKKKVAKPVVGLTAWCVLITPSLTPSHRFVSFGPHKSGFAVLTDFKAARRWAIRLRREGLTAEPVECAVKVIPKPPPPSRRTSRRAK